MGFFKKAVKAEAKLRLAIAGPSGSGKTYTSLAIASALGGPIAVVDTEHGSASKYADLFEFDVLELEPPFHPERYMTAIREAANAGYKVVILDSLSHAWSGTGGLLDVVNEATKRSASKNAYTEGWSKGTPIQNQLTDAIVRADLHIIATMRSKAEYVMEAGSNGKVHPKKVGLAPIQKDGMEYEFDIVLTMNQENEAIVEKTRCPELSGRVLTKPGSDIAIILKEWLHGVDVENSPRQSSSPQTTISEPTSPRTEHRPPPAPKSAPATSGKSEAAGKFHKQVAATFGGLDVDAARHWFIGQWTEECTPDNVRFSTNDMADNELEAMTAELRKRVREVRAEYQQHVANLDAINISELEEMAPQPA